MLGDAGTSTTNAVCTAVAIVTYLPCAVRAASSTLPNEDIRHTQGVSVYFVIQVGNTFPFVRITIVNLVTTSLRQARLRHRSQPKRQLDCHRICLLCCHRRTQCLSLIFFLQICTNIFVKRKTSTSTHFQRQRELRLAH